MIKTYRYNANRNTVSHILQGKNGVTVRYNFERGNVITKQKPELILKNEYAQNLLENSELFQKGLVTLVRSEKTIEDMLKENEEQEKKTKTKASVIEVASVVTASDLLAFVNEEDNREGSRMFKTVSSAMDWATKHNFAFPNYKPE
jgi:hypothetical protein